ncbi:MAG: sensor histidine kinase [Actinobacteria bacterium]|nr:sensor histidine kinase [Actinomycetota bacterium]
MRLRMRLAPATPERAGARIRHLIPPQVADAVIAVAVAVLGLASGLGARAQHEHMPLAAIPVLTAMGLVLYPRRRYPAAVLGAVAAGVITLIALGASLGGSFLAVLCACYSAAVYGSRRLVIGLITAAVVAVALIGIPQSFGFGHGVLHAIPVPTILAAAGAALFGLLIRNQFSARNAQLSVMAERAEWATAQREQEGRRATLAERLRIARELHDIVAHHVSVIVIQAQGAQRVADREPGRARQAMADVEQTARTALEEMRRMLGLLRSPDDGEDTGSLDVAHGVADIAALAARMTGAGVAVTVRTTGEPFAVPEDVGLAVYRIAQEALTNVLKHAGPAHAEVHLHYGEQLEITVTDDGRGAAAVLTGTAPPGAGRGTTGMRERVAMLGGRFTAGPQPGGGFRVHAVIPRPGILRGES